MERFTRLHRNGRPRRTPVRVEPLEPRQLLAYSPLGYSLPDLTVQGTAAPIAAYGQLLGIRADIRNLGASSLVEPLALQPGATSTADAQPTVLGVYIGTSPHFSFLNTIKIAEVDIGVVPQNSVVTVEADIPMPDQLDGLPGIGGTIYVFFRADDLGQILEADKTNNIQLQGVPVVIQDALPDLSGVVFDVPPVVQPGDSLRPTIKVANFGTVDSNFQGVPVTVYLVASDDDQFGPGDTILAAFEIDNIPPLSSVPLAPHSIDGDIKTIYDQLNTVTFPSIQVVTPSEPGQYYIGVFVDPNDEIPEINDPAKAADPALVPSQKVGPPIPLLTPAPILRDPSPETNLFPIPAFDLINTVPAVPVLAAVAKLMVADTGAASTSDSGSPGQADPTLLNQTLTPEDPVTFSGFQTQAQDQGAADESVLMTATTSANNRGAFRSAAQQARRAALLQQKAQLRAAQQARIAAAREAAAARRASRSR